MTRDRYDGFEVHTRNLQSILDAFRFFPEIGLKVLAKHGIGIGSAGSPEGGDWFPLGPWLATFHEITRSVGASKMYEIGKLIPKNATFPSDITDIFSGLESIDVAYHMNHRKNGTLMFDAQTGAMLEGIGHYRCKRTSNPRVVEVECDVPYPCETDRGIVSAIALRFEPSAAVQHLAEPECRSRGNARCRYAVSW